MRRYACSLLAFLLTPVVGADDTPPKVTSLSPAHLSVDVDAAKLRTLTVTFDRPMSTAGWSFYGGGPKFPALVGKPRWKNNRTCIVNVKLEPDHDYSLSLNYPAGGHFRSARGVRLAPTPWSFSTLPAVLPDPRRQRALNKKAFEALKDLLAERYSYYELRGLKWSTVFRKSAMTILSSQTTRAWAWNAGKMLEPAKDIHLLLRYRNDVIGTDRRAVDPLFRKHLPGMYLAATRRIGNLALAGRSKDGIGYLVIGGWTKALDLDGVEKALADMRDLKALIVDVRPNSGGDEMIARRVARWFVSGTKVYARHRSRTGRGARGFGPVFDRKITGNVDKKKRFAGPVAVLTSRYVMSSCEAFVLMMRQADNCTVVGQTTYGSSGNPKPHQLPNGVTIVLPSWQALLPDGTCFEGVGVAPDIEVAVEPGDLETRDPMLERAFEELRAKLRANTGDR